MTRGTTPTITYTFDTIVVADITECYLTIIQGSNVLEKELSDATVGESSLSWTLTQAETLALDAGKSATAQIRYKVGSSAYASKITKFQVDDVQKDGVI